VFVATNRYPKGRRCRASVAQVAGACCRRVERDRPKGGAAEADRSGVNQWPDARYNFGEVRAAALTFVR
jgi:hypothetical protein